jgi:hypothetical protein
MFDERQDIARRIPEMREHSAPMLFFGLTGEENPAASELAIRTLNVTPHLFVCRTTAVYAATAVGTES